MNIKMSGHPFSVSWINTLKPSVPPDLSAVFTMCQTLKSSLEQKIISSQWGIPAERFEITVNVLLFLANSCIFEQTRSNLKIHWSSI